MIYRPESWAFKNKTNFTNFIDSYLSPLHAFSAYTLLLNYLLPVIIIVILYSEILHRLKGNGASSAIKNSKSRKKSHKKITKMVLTIIICYIVCWTPYWSLQVFLYLYCHVYQREFRPTFTVLTNLIQVLCYMSSMLNPFIYSYMSEAFKADLQRALAQISCCVKLADFCKRRKEASQQNAAAVAAAATANNARSENNRNMTVTTDLVNDSVAMSRKRTLSSGPGILSNGPSNKTKLLKNGNKIIVFDDELDNLNSTAAEDEAVIKGELLAGEVSNSRRKFASISSSTLTNQTGNHAKGSLTQVVVDSCVNQIDDELEGRQLSNNSNNDCSVNANITGEKKDSTRKLVLKSSRNFEFEIKFHSINTNNSKFLNKIFNKNETD